MLTFLFILLVGSSLFVSYYFTNKISNQRKQILLLKYQNNNLKRKTISDQNEQIIVRYLSLNHNEGTIKKNCNLHLAPLDNSAVLNSLSENTTVQIQDGAEINKEMWYEISILSQDKTNSKGWIKSDCLNFKDTI